MAQALAQPATHHVVDHLHDDLPMSKHVLMIAGPNGAGKTTMSLDLITSTQPILYEYINADEIAKAIAPLHPETVALTASKMMIHRLQELLQNNKSFAFETTAAGTNYAKHLRTAKSQGYEVCLTFLWLDSHEQAIQRVVQRVKQGGHHIPKDVVQRRYYSGIRNLVNHYLPLSDRAVIINNSSSRKSK